MKLPHSLTTVTTFSKLIALLVFILLPFVGFKLGMEYQKMVYPTQLPASATTIQVDDMEGWKTYRSEKYGLQFRYPSDWVIEEYLCAYPSVQSGSNYTPGDKPYMLEYIS